MLCFANSASPGRRHEIWFRLNARRYSARIWVLHFSETLERQLDADDDFASAYVIAHNVAHHVQNELCILPEGNRLRGQSSEREANRPSVRIELQVDCLSGVWARHVPPRFGSLEHAILKKLSTLLQGLGMMPCENAVRAM